MTRTAKPSFLRLFLGGFAIGAVALVSVQATSQPDIGVIPAAHALTR